MKNTALKAAWATPIVSFVAAILLSLISSGNAAESGSEESQTEKLAKETPNPVANLISVPFQNNFNLPVNASLQAYYNVERPRFGADWQLRFQVQFLFPK